MTRRLNLILGGRGRIFEYFCFLILTREHDDWRIYCFYENYRSRLRENVRETFRKTMEWFSGNRKSSIYKFNFEKRAGFCFLKCKQNPRHPYER